MTPLGLIRKREGWALTLRGWLVLILGLGLGAVLGFQAVFPFLASHRPLAAEMLVVEGWLPDYSVREIRTEYERGRYRYLVTTGGPIIKGEILAEFNTYAEMTKAVLLKNGFTSNAVVAVPNYERFKDRTYAGALALRNWIGESQAEVKAVNVFTRGAHARRTWLLFTKAFAGTTEVGIIAGEDLRYDGRRWWRTSEGVRDILDEAIAYLYARFLFRPAPAPPPASPTNR